jgi:hypothetical protein
LRAALAAAAVAAAAALIAGPACAKPAVECLWSQLTPQQQAGRMPADPFGEPAPPLDDLTEPQITAMQTRCGLVEATRPDWLAVIDLYGWERSNAAWLSAHGGPSAANLEAAWSAMPATDRNALFAAARRAMASPPGQAAHDTAAEDAATGRFVAALRVAPQSDAEAGAVNFLRMRTLRLAIQDTIAQ